MARFSDKLVHAWNAFANERTEERMHVYSAGHGAGSGTRPDRVNYSYANERSIVSSIFTRVSIDVAGVPLRHVRTDEHDRYLEDIDSGLNNCFKVEANLDQAARMFRQDIVMTLCDKGVAAIVPVDTTISPITSGGFDIRTLRVGTITDWFPKHVRVELYDERDGVRKQITLPKSMVAIVENPLFSVMNGQNSTLQRLIRKISLLDGADEQVASGKLDIIIQLPYVIKSEALRQKAEQRRKDIEFQLKGSQYGIAYADGTEKITQLNRPAENNLLAQIEYLTKMLYGQLGLTEEVMLGTAEEGAMLNYRARVIEPMLDAIIESMIRTFLTKTARSQKQTIMYFMDAFKLVPMEKIAEIADAFARNEILSSNEVRQAIGYKPSTEAKADQLINSNMPQGDTGVPVDPDAVPAEEGEGEDELDAVLTEVEEMISTLGT